MTPEEVARRIRAKLSHTPMTVAITMECPTCEGDIDCTFIAERGSPRTFHDPGEAPSLTLEWPMHDCMRLWDRATTEQFEASALDSAEDWIRGYEESANEGPTEPEDRDGDR